MQTACMSAGICGTIPEANILHFLAAAPPRLQPQPSISGHVVTAADSTALGPDTAAMASFILYRISLMTYADAVQYCASSSYMGADWKLVEVQVRGQSGRANSRGCSKEYIKAGSAVYGSLFAFGRNPPYSLRSFHTHARVVPAGCIGLGRQRLDSEGRTRGARISAWCVTAQRGMIGHAGSSRVAVMSVTQPRLRPRHPPAHTQSHMQLFFYCS